MAIRIPHTYRGLTIFCKSKYEAEEMMQILDDLASKGISVAGDAVTIAELREIHFDMNAMLLGNTDLAETGHLIN